MLYRVHLAWMGFEFTTLVIILEKYLSCIYYNKYQWLSLSENNILVSKWLDITLEKRGWDSVFYSVVYTLNSWQIICNFLTSNNFNLCIWGTKFTNIQSSAVVHTTRFTPKWSHLQTTFYPTVITFHILNLVISFCVNIFLIVCFKM